MSLTVGLLANSNPRLQVVESGRVPHDILRSANHVVGTKLAPYHPPTAATPSTLAPVRIPPPALYRQLVHHRAQVLIRTTE